MSERILLADPDPELLAQLKAVIEDATDYYCQTVSDLREARPEPGQRPWDLVICAALGPGQAPDFLAGPLGQGPDLPVLLLSESPSPEEAAQAMQMGAFDLLARPVAPEQLLLAVERALQWRRRQKGRAGGIGPEPTGLIPAASRTMQEIQRQVSLAADTMATVLITGESGTGKEMMARALHQLSSRRERPFVVVNCAAIPEDFMEGELFGHLPGAMGGAPRKKVGLVAEAEGGTLFLDEIGELSRGLQAKLLRLVQDGQYRPAGGGELRRADVRIIAASSQNLDLKVAEGAFREDLYYHLNVIRLDLPPLRRRPEDIPVLARFFLERYSRLYGVKDMDMAPRTLEVLQSRPWPGNVRELENVIKRAVILSQGLRLPGGDLFSPEPPGPAGAQDDDLWNKPFKEARELVLEDFQQRYVQKLLARHQGNVSKAAEASGIKRQYLHKIMRQTGIKAAVFKRQI